jgi:hypothetical protein
VVEGTDDGNDENNDPGFCFETKFVRGQGDVTTRRKRFAQIVLEIDENQDFFEYIPEEVAYQVQCRLGVKEEGKLPCPMPLDANGNPRLKEQPSITARCNGTEETVLNVTCPIISRLPLCASAGLGVGEEACRVTNFTSTETTCECDLCHVSPTTSELRRRLGLKEQTGFVEVAAMTTFVISDALSVINSGISLSVDELEEAALVLGAFVFLWGSSFIMVISAELFHQFVRKNREAVKKAKTVQHRSKRRANAIVNGFAPPGGKTPVFPAKQEREPPGLQTPKQALAPIPEPTPTPTPTPAPAPKARARQGSMYTIVLPPGKAASRTEESKANNINKYTTSSHSLKRLILDEKLKNIAFDSSDSSNDEVSNDEYFDNDKDYDEISVDSVLSALSDTSDNDIDGQTRPKTKSNKRNWSKRARRRPKREELREAEDSSVNSNSQMSSKYQVSTPGQSINTNTSTAVTTTLPKARASFLKVAINKVSSFLTHKTPVAKHVKSPMVDKKTYKALRLLINNYLPGTFSEVPRHSRLASELIGHQIIAIIFTTNSFFKRSMAAIELLTLATSSAFLLSLLFGLQYPIDDGTCSIFDSESSCSSETSMFDSSQAACTWHGQSEILPVVGVVSNVTTTNFFGGLSTYCDWREPVFDKRTFLLVTIVVCKSHFLLSYP